jgi:hypothetical protein
MKRLCLALLFGLFAVPALAGEVTVVDAKARASGKDTFYFTVTLRHGDTGWKHYADNWEVLGPDGKLLGRRVLLHPHENEQPFTRSLSGVKIPAGIKQVTIRGHDKVHKYGGKELVINLPGR